MGARAPEETADSSAHEPEDLTGGQLEGQSSGAGELLGKAGVDRGLLTPENTPDPESEVQGSAQESEAQLLAEAESQLLAESIEPVERPTLPPKPLCKKGAKEKQKQRQVPTRRSQRLRKRQNPGDTEDGGAHSVNATVIYGSSEICLALDRNWEEVTYLFPLLQHAAEQGYEELYNFHVVIAAGALQKNAERLGAAPNRSKIHRGQLVKPPKLWKDLEKHPLGNAFKEDAKRKIEALIERGVWKEIPIAQAKSTLIPLKWVFTYKFDKYGWLERCKSRICERGDLQEADWIISTYAATLAARSFRTAMAVAAESDLEVRQLCMTPVALRAKMLYGLAVARGFMPLRGCNWRHARWWSRAPSRPTRPDERRSAQSLHALWSSTIIEASDEVNQDLFWGIRGSGQNYGIVMESTFETWPPTIRGMHYNADMIFAKIPWDES
ncbi:hypothetical protein DL764_007496 [Monosporascus ibericus]|uniref:Uncharacterized protein n=1 Tax=Monosporascus ibericus TaxID=155417 RepID=A0A4Q4T3S9_9PEZI|nr:hypothetical protein DL764_007496 [Monosporascus ibericus]